MAEPYSGSCGENLKWEFEESTGILSISGDGEMEDCDWFSRAPWYAFRDRIRGVVFGGGVTAIGSSAFEGCAALTELRIPESVTQIGRNAFLSCSKLNLFSVAAGNPAFCDINGVLFSADRAILIRYPAGREGAYAVPESVTQIGERAFHGCASLRQIHIPDSVTDIGGGAFIGCSKLNLFSVAAGNPAFCEIDGVLFSADRTMLIRYPAGREGAYTVPDSVTEIGEDAFQGCASLTEIHIPDGVTKIGECAFQGCASLTEIYIPDGVTEIGECAFQGCASLTQIHIPDGVTGIGRWTFFGCASLTQIHIPESAAEIGRGAFTGCTALTRILIPESITGIEWDAFQNCTALRTVLYPGTQEEWDDIEIHSGNDCLTDAKPICGYRNPNRYLSGTCGGNLSWEFDKREGRLTVSGSRMMMPDFPEGRSPFLPFRGNLREVIVEEGITSIGGNAFAGCAALKKLELPERLTMIFADTFAGCTGLEEVHLPESLTAIGEDAFAGCDALRTVHYGGTAEDWERVEIWEGNECLTDAGPEFDGDDCNLDDIDW